MGVGRRRYVVEVSSAQALKLSHEQMALAASVDNGPTRLLVFRDRFLAAKIASLSGGTFRQGQLAPVGPEAAAGGIVLEGRTLLLDASVDAEPDAIEA